MSCGDSSSSSDDDSYSSSSDDSDDDGFERCSRTAHMRQNGGLPFDIAAIQNIIFELIDKFNVRVLMNNPRVHHAMLITGGLALVGSRLGQHFGGKVGAVVGGTVGCACGLGVSLVSLRDVWEDVKARLWELFELVYDYLAGLGINDYQAATGLLAARGEDGNLARMIIEVAASLLKKPVSSSF